MTPFAAPEDPYRDDWDSFLTVRECAELLGINEVRVCELARRGILRSRDGLVQPAVVAGITA